MQHLRLVGVHEDGLHLLLADDEGERYAVPLDEPLRAAVRRDRPRLGQLQIEMTGGLRPRDVQTMIRAGMSATEVAERAGWPVEKVHRYEGPILAEREHIAGLARQVRLRPRGGVNGSTPTLDTRVAERLRSRQIDLGSAEWDSRRAEQGSWTVVLAFKAGGQEREASWHFDQLARTVTAADDEARWLSEDEDQPAPGPIPAPHLANGRPSSTVYDVDAEGGIGVPSRHSEAETVDLMAAMRERSSQRGRRRRPKGAEVPGLDRAPDDALPLEELARDPRDELPPPAHTHPEDDPEVAKEGPVEARIGSEAAARRSRRDAPTEPVRQPGPAPTRPATRRNGARSGSTNGSASTNGSGATNGSASTNGSGATRGAGTNRASGPRATDASTQPDQPDQPAERSQRSEAKLENRTVSDGSAGAAAPKGGRSSTGSRPGASRTARPATVASERSAGTDQDDGGEVIQEPASAAARKAASARRSGRTSVPSWDDIMFGRRGD